MSTAETSGDGRKLQRVLGFWALVAFGVGDILGAGIYALVGEIAGIAGDASWMAFGVALAVAGLTALAYAELGSRFPKSGGEAHFCQLGLGSPNLALLTGWLVLCSGIVSMATVARAFAGYALGFFDIGNPTALTTAAVLFLVVIAGINVWGIRQTSALNIVFTIVEIVGLLIVLVAGVMFLSGGDGVVAAGEAVAVAAESKPEAATTETVGWTAILSAAALAFFAFIGFEDMVNVAEEVKNPRRNMPLAILTAVAFAGLLYMAVIAVATRVVPPEELSESHKPLLDVVTRAAPSVPAVLFTGIALFAVGNTGLLNFVTASRLLYGMARQKLVPSWFGALHPATHTPHRATGAVLLLAVVLAASGSLSFLAGTTAVLLLAVFLVVNVSLLAAKTFRRDRVPAHDGFRVPAAIPVVAALSCLGLGAFVPPGSMLRALVLVGIGLVLMLIRSREPAVAD